MSDKNVPNKGIKSLIKWCEEEIQEMRSHREELESGVLQISDKRKGQWVNISQEWIEDYKEKEAYLQAIIDRNKQDLS